MTQFRKTQDNIFEICIVVLSVIGLFVCTAILFPQVRQMIIASMHRELDMSLGIYKLLHSFAMGGVCFILFLDYCVLSNSGRKLTNIVKQEMKDCLSEIDFRNLAKPVFILFGVYLLGASTMIRSNFLFRDDIWRSVGGGRAWLDFSRYVTEFLSIFIHADTNLTDISPWPQLLAIFVVSISSVLLVYILCDRKINTAGLLASIPLGLSPYFINCLTFKFDAPYMALSILVSIVPFLFVSRKKAFVFCSIISLLIMCMTYQAASGIYMLIVIILGFQGWNSRSKPDKNIISFFGMAVFAFCMAMLMFRLFLMKPTTYDYGYTSTAMHQITHMIPGILNNIKDYAMTINNDFGFTWKMGIVFVCMLFIIKSVFSSVRKKSLAFIFSVLMIGISFVLSFGVYILLAKPLYELRCLYGFGVFLSILCIYIVYDYKKIAVIGALALNYCFFVFAFSYGNALADQERYAEFRIGLLWHDLSLLYPAQNDDAMILIQLENSIEFAPSIKNIAKHYPIIERMVPKRLGDNWDMYFLTHYNHSQNTKMNNLSDFFSSDENDFRTLNLPVILDSYYHTIKGDENRILVILKH